MIIQVGFREKIVIMSSNVKTNINDWEEVDEMEDWGDWVVLISTLEKDEIERRLALIEVRINLIKKFKNKRVQWCN